jgi:hypothetical protein
MEIRADLAYLWRNARNLQAFSNILRLELTSWTTRYAVELFDIGSRGNDLKHRNHAGQDWPSANQNLAS